MDESVFDEYAEKYEDLYGDMVYVEIGGDGVDDVASKEGLKRGIWLTIIILFCLGRVGIFILSRHSSVFSMQTADGDIVNATRPMSRKEVIVAIRESGIKPSDSTYRAIRERIQ